MDDDGTPYLGILQPRIGLEASLTLYEVKRESKSQFPGSVIRGILAQNLVVLRDRKWAHLPNPTKRNAALAGLCKPTSPSQIHRITKQLLGTSIDLLERLAVALDVRPQDLITPYFASVQYTPQPTEDADGLQQKPNRSTAVSRKL